MQTLIIYIILVYTSLTNSWAQSTEQVERGSLYSIIDTICIAKHEQGDTLLDVVLKEIEVIPPYQFKNNRERKKYNQLVEDVIKAYPMSIIVGQELARVNKEFEEIYIDKKDKKKYIKWYEKHTYNTYIDSLKTLSMRQNRLLLKLIERETGKSPYKLIKEYRGSSKAMMWRAMALLFGANLNATYNEEDEAMIEHIIQRYKAGEFL